MRRTWRTFWLLGLAWLPVLGQATDTAPTAQDVVRHATTELLQVVREGKGYYDHDPDRFYRAVESTLAPIVDFKGFARSVMAVYARRASAEQSERFAETFKWGLVKTYAKALLAYSNETIRVLPPDRGRERPGRATVRMEVVSTDGHIYPVEYSMVLDDLKHWRVRNVIINGVNLGLTYRNQFANAMNDQKNNGDMDRVIDDWSQVLETVKTAGLEQ